MKRWALAAAAMAMAASVGGAEAAVRVVAAQVVVRTPALRIAVEEVVVVRRGHGRLDINVSPERAKVYLDGRYLGRGDTSRIVLAGIHRVKVVLGDGREVAAETVHVDAGHVTRVRLDL